MLALLAVSVVPVAAIADAGEISVPPGARQAASQSLLEEAKIQPPIGFWDELLLVWLEAKIGPPIG